MSDLLVLGEEVFDADDERLQAHLCVSTCAVYDNSVTMGADAFPYRNNGDFSVVAAQDSQNQPEGMTYFHTQQIHSGFIGGKITL